MPLTPTHLSSLPWLEALSFVSRRGAFRATHFHDSRLRSRLFLLSGRVLSSWMHLLGRRLSRTAPPAGAHRWTWRGSTESARLLYGSDMEGGGPYAYLDARNAG